MVWLLGQPALLEWQDGISRLPDLLSVDRDDEVLIGVLFADEAFSTVRGIPRLVGL